MLNAAIITLAVLLLILLLYNVKKDNRRSILFTKTTLSSLFIILAILQPHASARYYQFILIGLVLCLGGDVFLALSQKHMFLVGLISFLLGHVFYIIAFITVSPAYPGLWAEYFITLVISGRVYFWLRPNLGSMNYPVLIYIAIITIMLCASWSILFNTELARTGRIIVFAGAFLFYTSDVFVARNRFVKSEFLNPVIGLPLYYAGQFLLAFSVGIV